MYVLKDIIQRYELNAKKSLGQNFILDTNLLSKIARMALTGVDYDALLEVGPGPGGLTQAVLEQTSIPLNVIEKDDRCAKALCELSKEYPNRLNIFNDDALIFDESKLGQNVCIIANLPYNISTVLLVKWLKNIKQFSALTLMFQKEVAERLTAKENEDAYGRLAVLTQWLADVEILMILPPSVFTPAPKVHSALVRIMPKRNTEEGFNFETMEKLTAAAFGQRRKMLRSSLKVLSLSPEKIEQMCGCADVPTSFRGEQVSVLQFCQMARWLYENG